MAWRVVALLWVAFFLNYMDRQIVFSIFPVLKHELAFTDTQLGLLGSLFTWTYSFCMPLTGRLSDLLPRKWMVISSLILWSGAMVGTATSNSVAMFLFWRILMGVVESLYIPAAYGLIASLHSDATRARAFAVHQMAQLAGIVGGGWYGGWAAESIGWRPGYVAMGAIGISYAIILAAAFRGIPNRSDARPRTWSEPPSVLRSVPYRLLLLATFFFSLLLWLTYAWLPNHVFERHHLSLAESGLIATVFVQASSLAGVLVGGFVADRYSRQRPEISRLIVAAGDVVSAPFVWATFAASSLTGMKVAATCYGVTSGLHLGNVFPAASKVVKPQDYGFAAGLLNFAGGLAGGAGMLLAGAFKTTIGLERLSAFAAVGCAGAGIVLALHTIRARRFEERAAHT